MTSPTLTGHFVKAHTKAHTMGQEKGDPKAARFSCVLPLLGSNQDSSDPESVPAPGDDSAPRRVGVVSPPPASLARQYSHTKAHTMEGAENRAARAAGLGGPVPQYTTEGSRALRDAAPASAHVSTAPMPGATRDATAAPTARASAILPVGDVARTPGCAPGDATLTEFSPTVSGPLGTLRDAWALVRLLAACVPVVLVCLVTGEGLARADDAAMEYDL